MQHLQPACCLNTVKGPPLRRRTAGFAEESCAVHPQSRIHPILKTEHPFLSMDTPTVMASTRHTHLTVVLQMKQTLIEWLRQTGSADWPVFLRNKLAQIIVSIVQVRCRLLEPSRDALTVTAVTSAHTLYMLHRCTDEVLGMRHVHAASSLTGSASWLGVQAFLTSMAACTRRNFCLLMAKRLPYTI